MKYRKYLLSALTVLANLILLLIITNAAQNPQATTVNSDTRGTEVAEVSATPQVIGETSENTEEFLVTRVIDGDTIELENKQKVRYIGIDSPETGGDCFALEATLKNIELVKGKRVRLIKDKSETDRYGRLLRYVYVDDPSTSSGQATFVNDFLVRGGYAIAKAYKPDVSMQSQLSEAEKEARENNKGLWKACQQ